MSFHKANQAFGDARKQITAQSNPVSWELSIGLQEMCTALESELSFLRRQVATLSKEVSALNGQRRTKSS